nr:MAG TPA: hypothetical protein [Caudoviricetes sp.]
MSVGFGMAPDAQGNGTTPDDLQAVLAAQYPEPGIISGCTVSTRSSMEYVIAPGAVVVHIAPSRAVLVPVVGQTITTRPAPATGARTDYVYVEQQTQPVNGSISARVAVGTQVPDNAVVISKREIKAGMTGTNAAPETANVTFARPIGGTLGVLFSHKTETDTVHDKTDGVITRGKGMFFLPTDRALDIRLTSSISSVAANVAKGTLSTSAASSSPSDRGSVNYDIYIDNKLVLRRERVFTNVWDTVDYSDVVVLPKGSHTIHYTVSLRVWGWEKWTTRYEGFGAKYPSDVLRVIDMGVAKE